MKKQFLEIGKIVGTHGLRGELRVDPWCDGAGFLCKFKRLYFADGTELKVLSTRPHKNIAILLLDSVNTPEQADALRGKVLYMNRDDVKLPKGTNFVQDLIGLDVLDGKTDESLGTITDVLKTGANDVYEVTRNGKKYYVPVIPDVVTEKNIDGGFVRLNVIEGIFDDEN